MDEKTLFDIVKFATALAEDADTPEWEEAYFKLAEAASGLASLLWTKSIMRPLDN